MSYKCDQCGACCRQLSVQITKEDLKREFTALFPHTYFLKNPSYPGASYELRHKRGCGQGCPLLSGNLCTIHQTKPFVCSDFSAGSDQCQDARRAEGLPELEPEPKDAH